MISPTPRRRRTGAAIAALAALALVPGLLQLPAQAQDGGLPAVPGLTRTAGTGERVLPGTLGDPVGGLLDVDLRGATVPTALQRTAAAGLGATDLRWNDFGTPASILPADGVLARATSGDPVAAARAYLVEHASAFGLPASAMADLELVNDQELAFGGGHAVLLRQRFGDLTPALGSMVTVGVARGEIAYVSSSLARTTQAPPAPRLSPLQGWLAAAENVGLELGDDLVSRIAPTVESGADGWTRLDVPGLGQEQQVRLRALALADGTVRPVLEANVVDVQGGSASAYTVMVDAVSGAVLRRENQVENAVGGLADGPSTLPASNTLLPFTGTITATACGPKHTFEVTDTTTKSIVLVGASLNPANDITLQLNGPGGAILATADTLTSPETLIYSPGSIPKGTYSGQVCPFEGGSVLPPANYQLTVATSDQTVGAPDGGTPGGGVTGTAGNPRWRFFAANPTLDGPNQTPRNSVVACWFNAESKPCTLSTGSVRNVAAPGPWDNVTATRLPSFTTIGNNANTHEAWASPLTPGGTFQAPYSVTQQYTTPFTDAWNNSRCSPTQLVPGGNDIDFSVGNLFVTHNRMHDFSYYLGFNEGNYNLQLDNLGRGGLGGDPETGNVQAGALSGGQPSYLGRDNANQIALQDGVTGITNQYLFQPIAGAFYAPCTDGGLDMGIVGHEYTHAISNRMVGGPDEGLTSEQGGAMGESWSDQVAAEFQFSHGYSNGGNVWAVGAYATGNPTVAIRDYAINHNPLNYSDYGFDTTGPEVHADGEIWNGVAWEIRQALVAKYNAKFPYADKTLQLRCAQGSQNKGPQRPGLCPGNRRWLQLMFDSFLLQQGATSMLDARDAFLAADQMRFGGENRRILQAAFARRGMGKGATTKDGEDTSPKPSFASASGRNTRVTFKTRPGRIYVGDYEARSAPIADTFAKTKKLARTASFTPGRYDMLYVGPRHGFMRFHMTVTGAKRQVVRVRTTKNLAARKSGARIIGATPGGLHLADLIDGTETTPYGAITSGNVDATKPRIAVDLAGTKARTIRTVAVSAMLRRNQGDPDGGSRFTALRKFAVEACTTRCASPRARWKRVYTSPGNAFPGDVPRPVAPNLNMRAFAIKPTRATALRLVVLENQCTGFAGYAGEQDSDPLNDTDCKSASDRGTIAHVAEFQAFSSRFPSWRSSYGIDHPERSLR